jgi:4-amino-4-deoxy-L-arabinose transferase-like glycosyltransferase
MELRRYGSWGLVLIVLLFAASIRFRFLDVPLERDEGEFAYSGQLILQGIPPYVQAYNMKLPGTYAAYAVIMAVFGESARGIRLGLLVINAAAIILVYLLGRRLLDDYAGVAAAASYALLSAGPYLLGFFAHATHFVVLFVLGGLLLLLKGTESDRPGSLFWSGTLFGSAFLMKQHGILFVFFALLYLIWCAWRARPIRWPASFRRISFFLSGAIVPFGLTCLIIFAVGAFGKFWFWTFKYAGEYVSEYTVSDGMAFLMTQITPVMGPSYLLWLLAGIGLIAPFWDTRTRRYGLFAVGFLLFSFLATCPGFYFRQHYFILMLPAVALLAGIAVSSGRHLLSKKWSRSVSGATVALVFLAAFGYSVYGQTAFFFLVDPYVASRIIYGQNPFAESVEVANYIKARTDKNDRIAVIGSEPQIYFYSDRHSATGYIYTYSLMENQKYALKMQQEMIREVEEARPKYLILVQVDWSWLPQAGSETRIFDWARKYSREHYELVGIVDIFRPKLEPTRYVWGSEAATYVPGSPYYLLVFKRKD